ncbi:hypothetical protein TNIN_434101 [Trichonephila inaurata madagascariensis]|uniref:Uncharacterized protein n=1 Tax=Trichonephila inaurata madagascariensis TaxID=2747483 RepID=A0A8X6XPK0_9ARAC|nr:hypothetical protein TNIN_434101 [Trichonephila inaurata madagascariensis]
MGCSNTKAFPGATGMENNGTLTNAMNVLNAIDPSQVKEEGDKLINQAKEEGDRLANDAKDEGEKLINQAQEMIGKKRKIKKKFSAFHV